MIVKILAKAIGVIAVAALAVLVAVLILTARQPPSHFLHTYARLFPFCLAFIVIFGGFLLSQNAVEAAVICFIVLALGCASLAVAEHQVLVKRRSADPAAVHAPRRSTLGLHTLVITSVTGAFLSRRIFRGEWE